MIRPAAPAKAKSKLKTLRIFWVSDVFFANRPVCLSQRSARRPRSRQTTVTALQAMKSGFRPKAPTSEMYAMRWPGSIDGRCRSEDVDQTISIAISIPSHEKHEMAGRIQYDIIHMFVESGAIDVREEVGKQKAVVDQGGVYLICVA